MIERDESNIAERLRAAKASCWAVAAGGTRRAYLASGGILAGPDDLHAYFDWLEREQRALIERLFDIGVRTVIVVGRLPSDRGEAYAAHARRAVHATMVGPERLAMYARRGLRVSFGGNLVRLGEAVRDEELASSCEAVREQTRGGTGGDLVYLYRGVWQDASEEAIFGYELGLELGRPPTLEDLIRAYYGLELPPLAIYVGSGRPQLTRLRPPFVSGTEACYWSVNCPYRLSKDDLSRLAADYLDTRRTQGTRSYPTDADARAALKKAIEEADHHILGTGRQRLGFWHPDSTSPGPSAPSAG